MSIVKFLELPCPQTHAKLFSRDVRLIEIKHNPPQKHIGKFSYDERLRIAQNDREVYVHFFFFFFWRRSKLFDWLTIQVIFRRTHLNNGRKKNNRCRSTNVNDRMVENSK